MRQVNQGNVAPVCRDMATSEKTKWAERAFFLSKDFLLSSYLYTKKSSLNPQVYHYGDYNSIPASA